LHWLFFPKIKIMSYTYEYPRPSVTADCVVFNYHDNRMWVLLIQRKDEPYKDHWAFPGGFIEMDEELEESANRELMEETGLKWKGYEQVGAFGKLGRDPRGRVISVAFVGFVENHEEALAGSDAANLQWFDIGNLPTLAFDHNEMFRKSLEHVKDRLALSQWDKPPFGLDQDIADEIFSVIKNV
jgi:8-oxo-dGTP diphosphatase